MIFKSKLFLGAISCNIGKLIIPVVIATSLAQQFSWFLQLSYSGVVYMPGLEAIISVGGGGGGGGGGRPPPPPPPPPPFK